MIVIAWLDDNSDLHTRILETKEEKDHFLQVEKPDVKAIVVTADGPVAIEDRT